MPSDHRPIVHIGHSKTGTTWFQKSFYSAATSHRFIDCKVVRQALLEPNGLAFETDRARALLLEAADGKPPLICDERLSGSNVGGGLHEMVAPEMARRIKAMFPDARIVIGIRAQPGMLAASYSQYVKGGGTFGVLRFLFPDSYFFPGSPYRTQAPRFDLSHFDYQRLIRFYFDLFGRENVHVLLFERFRASPLDCGKELAESLGLEIDQAKVSGGVRNPGLNRNALRVMRFYNLFTARKMRDKNYLVHIPGLFEVRKKLHRLLNRIFRRKAGSEQLLGAAASRWIEARFAPSNRELSEMLGIDLGQYGYPVVTPDAPPPSPLPRGRKLRAT